MPAIVYRILFDNQPADQKQLNRIDEIIVEQVVDKAWEAQLMIPICVDDKGMWAGEDEAFMKNFKRVRIEIKIGDKDYVPLIDGPIVGAESEMRFEPGKSKITLVVHDDSSYLSRKAELKAYENKADHEIVTEIFNNLEQIKSPPDIDSVPASPDKRTPVVMQRGTPMGLLQTIAQRNNMHAYILPGEKSGESQGKFKKFAKEPDGLPDLILLGPDRNVEYFNPRQNALGPVKVSAATLSLSDKTVQTQQSNLSDVELMDADPTYASDDQVGEEFLPPQVGQTMDLAQALKARMEKAAMCLEADGSLITHCYPDVLQAYRVVRVLAANGRLSGNYLLTKVTHHLTRSEYTQTFTAQRNSLAKGAQNQSSNPGAGGLGLSVDVSFNISGSIF